MPTNQTISELPPITYTRSWRAKYQRITVQRDKTIVVTIPRNGSKRQGREFVESKISWIKKQLQKIDQYEKQQDSPDLAIDLEKAQDELFGRLDYFSDKYNLPYNRVVFRCQKTKWGSCSGKNNISLNINIAYLSKELQDYVLLHELVHIKIKNHSKKFWGELDRLVGGEAKLLQKELRRFRMMIRG